MSEEIYPIYIEALLKEIRTVSPQHNHKKKLESIFFGGGTPSLLEPQHIEMILQELKNFFEIHDEVEITMECNPDTVTEEKILAYKKLGINRMSFGVQSFSKKDMEAINRNYDPRIIPKIITLASKHINNISLDLIFGLSGQTPKLWEDNLKRAVELPITHLSTYELMYEEGTLMTQHIDTLKRPSEKSILKMYDINNTFLPRHGFKQYEISNWYKGNPCKHNHLFWKGEEYIGFGLSAESFIEGNIVYQTKNLKAYIEDSSSHRKTEILTHKERFELYIQNRLRLLEEGIDIEFLENRFGKMERKKLEIILKKFPEYIEKRGYRYILKKEKCMLLDQVLLEMNALSK